MPEKKEKLIAGTQKVLHSNHTCVALLWAPSKNPRSTTALRCSTSPGRCSTSRHGFPPQAVGRKQSTWHRSPTPARRPGPSGATSETSDRGVSAHKRHSSLVGYARYAGQRKSWTHAFNACLCVDLKELLWQQVTEPSQLPTGSRAETLLRCFLCLFGDPKACDLLLKTVQLILDCRFHSAKILLKDKGLCFCRNFYPLLHAQ